jgi:hypothetical protein
MRARIKGLSLALDGGQELTLSLPGDWRQEYVKLKDADVEVEIKKYREKRSLDANGLLWAMCREIGQALGIPDVEVYRKAVIDAGEYEHLPIKAAAVDTFARRWESKGLGWFVQVVDDSKLPGYKLVKAYYGSSTYDTREMSKLLDYIVDEAQQIGLTLRASEKEIEEAKRRWGES